MDDMITPRYGRGSLADLLPAVGSQLGADGPVSDPFGLPRGQRYVVVLVDGLGAGLLARAAGRVPWLSTQAKELGPITVGVPSTTVTSLTSLGTGLPPGQHGLVGWAARVPETGELLNHLAWRSTLDPLTYQPHRTTFQRLREAGVEVSTVSPERFATTPMTRAALRGPEFLGIRDEENLRARAALTAGAARRGSRSVTFVYERGLDHVGHDHGTASHEWSAALSFVDDLCCTIRERLDDDTTMIITGDHGMVDVHDDHRLVIEDEPDLAAGLTAVAGEGRFRQVYVDHESVEAVAARWRDRLGERAWVRTREEAIEEGWFGPVAASVRERYGHVVAAMRGDWALLTRTVRPEFGLIGMHGSLTRAEMMVPLLVA